MKKKSKMERMTKTLAIIIVIVTLASIIGNLILSMLSY